MTDTDEEYDSEENIEESNISIYDKPFSIDDEFIFYFKEEGEVIGKIKNIEIDEKKITLEINDKDYFLEMNNDEQILLKTSNYEIIDLEKIIEFKKENLDDITNELLTKDIYPEIEIKTEEVKKKIYSDVDKKEDLISSLIMSMNLYNNKFMINVISDISQEFMLMIKNMKEVSLEYFLEITNFLKDEKLPEWLIPVSSNIKRLYLDNIEEPIIQDDYIKVDFIKELNEIYNFTHESNITYKNLINIYYNTKYSSLQNLLIEDGFKINNYAGDYFRNCITDDNCTGIDEIKLPLNPTKVLPTSKSSIDERRNHKGLKFPNTINSKTVLETLQKPEQLNISSILYFSDNNILNLPFTYDSKNLSLAEKSVLIRHNYTIDSKRIRIHKILKENFEIIQCILDDEYLDKYDFSKIYDPNISYQYKINETIDKDLFNKLLQKYIPDQNTIIDKFIYKEYYNYIFNYEDFEKLFIKYNLNITNITPINKLKINKIIHKNIEKYNKAYHRLNTKIKYKKEILQKKILTQNEIIALLKEFIYKQLNITYKNYYLRKFIDQFTRSNEQIHESSQWLYNKFNNEKILCTHHLYSSKIDINNTAYETMITKFGDIPNDGIIYCKVCGEFLDHEEFSIFEGFSDNKPIIKEAIIEEKEKVELNEKQKEIYNIIQQLSNSISINLHENDTMEIIDLYDIIKNNALADNRYDINDVSIKNHPKILNAEKKDLKKTIMNIQGFMIETNKLLFIFICIFIFIQTSIPSYNINNIKLIDLTDNKYLTNPIINEKSLESILNRINYIYNQYKENIFWKYSKDFLNEYNDPGITSPKNQLINTIKHLISPLYPKILERIKYYQEYIGITKNTYLRKYWTIFRPLPTNKTIIDINTIINNSIEENKDYLLRNFSTKYSLENITLLQDIDSSFDTTKYKLVEIKNIKLLNNKSFLRLYDLILSLYGNQIINKNKNIYMELLINSLFNTSDEDRSYLEGIFRKYDWKQGNRISFLKLRDILFGINSYCKNKGDCLQTLSVFNHIAFSNANLQLLNTYPKRNYTYNPINVIPNKPFDELNDDNPIKNIFNIYCFNINKYLIKKPKNISRIHSIYIDIDTTYNPCEDLISPSNENFKMILDTIYSQNSFKDIFFIKSREYNKFTIEDIKNTEKKNIIESRLTKLLNEDSYKHIKLLKEIFDETDKYIQTTDLEKEDYEKIVKEYEGYFSKVIDDSKSMLKTIEEYIQTTDNITESQKKIIKIDKLYDILENIIDNNELNDIIIQNFIQNIIFILSRIKNQTNRNIHGCQFHNNISNSWKLTEYNKDIMEEFILEKEFLLHNSIFIKTKDKYKGFSNYMQNPNQSLYFQQLYNYIKPYTENINLIVGKKGNLFTNEYASYLIKYMFVLLLRKIVEYLQMDDTKGEISKDSNVIFQSLEDMTNIDTLESNKQISSFLMDILINIIQEYNDPLWFININSTTFSLEKKIVQQKEREKQNLLNKLDTMSPEDRLVYSQLQNYGISNWYQDRETENQEFVNSDAYRDMNNEERNEIFREISDRNQTEIDVFQIDMDQHLGIHDVDQQEEEGYLRINDFNADDGGDDGGDGGDEDFQPIDDNFE